MNSTEIYQTKRSFLTAGQKLVQGLPKPRKKFYQDLFYGMAKTKSVILSDIARSLEEPIHPLYTTKRLSRQVSHAADLQQVQKNYSQMIQKHIIDDALVIVDESDITKPYAEKMEALGHVHDGSHNRIEKGYPTVNFSIATTETKHPIPLYHSVCSAKAEGFESMNLEVAKGFNHVDRLFDGKQYTLVMDRGYDSNKIYEYIENQNHHFITRLNDRRYLLHKNKRIKVPDLANRRKGKINFSTTIKGTHYDLKASHIEVRLPVLKDTPLYMVVVYGYGKKPMKLLTNLEIKGKPDVLRVLKGYITRWRIEELFRVQKQEFGLEKIRTMSLNSLQILYHIMNYLIGHYSMMIEKNNGLAKMIIERARSTNDVSTIKFYLYRFIRGVSNILSFDSTGIRHFHRIEERSKQLSLL